LNNNFLLPGKELFGMRGPEFTEFAMVNTSLNFSFFLR
jgi:hypothetical protein